MTLELRLRASGDMAAGFRLEARFSSEPWCPRWCSSSPPSSPAADGAGMCSYSAMAVCVLGSSRASRAPCHHPSRGTRRERQREK